MQVHRVGPSGCQQQGSLGLLQDTLPLPSVVLLRHVAALFVNLAQVDKDLGINTLHIGNDCYVLGNGPKAYDECHIRIHSKTSDSAPLG